MSDSQKNSRRGFTLIELLVVVLIVGGLVALLLPATRSARPAARRSQCRNNLKQIGLALHNYHDVYGSLPPAYTVDEEGNRLHSWRTLILPFLDQAPLYDQIDLTKPWDDPANAVAFETTVVVYQCPSADIDPNHTTYVALVGDDRALSPDGRTFRDFIDGTSKTAVVTETLPGQTMHWMSPFDDRVDIFKDLNSESKTYHMGGIQILLADGSVRFISAELDQETFTAISTIAGQDGDLTSNEW